MLYSIIFIYFLILFILFSKNYLKEKFENNKSNIKICILIISVNNCTNKRWTLEKQVWKKYMDLYDNIDCYFIECTIEGFNKININCKESYIPGIYQKTIESLKKVGNKYDFYVRTNLSSFFIFENLINILNTITQKTPMFIGSGCDEANWTSGTSIVLNKKAKNILTTYGQQKQYYFNTHIPDDVLIGKVFKNYNISCKAINNILYVWDYNNDDDNQYSIIQKKKYAVLRLRNNNLTQYHNIINILLQKYYHKSI